MVLGDTHGEWNRLNDLIEREVPERIIQLGDFGFWPNFEEFSLNKIKLQGCILEFIDGNHEDHWSLRERTKHFPVVHDGIFYNSRGSVIQIHDNMNALCFGGADSIDKSMRKIGLDWFPEEVGSQKDFENLPSDDTKIECVFSHTAPQVAIDYLFNKNVIGSSQYIDPTVQILDIILEKWRPKYWFFGHFHVPERMTFMINKTCFTTLGMLEKYNKLQHQAYVILDE